MKKGFSSALSFIAGVMLVGAFALALIGCGDAEGGPGGGGGGDGGGQSGSVIWTKLEIPGFNVPPPELTSDSIFAVSYCNGKFFTGGTSLTPAPESKIAVSSNGTTGWNNYVSALGLGGTIQSITYGNGKYIAVGTPSLNALPGVPRRLTASSSSDGESWTPLTIAPFYNTDFSGSIEQNYNTIFDIIYAENTFVAVGLYSNAIVNPPVYESKIAYSGDGEYWVKAAGINEIFGEGAIRSISYGAGKFVAVGDKGIMAYSEDGEEWHKVSNSTFASNNTIYDITFGSGKFLAVGGAGASAWSSNGTSWTAIPYTATGLLTDPLMAVSCSDDGLFVIGTNNGLASYSKDLTNWTKVKNTNMDYGSYGVGILDLAFGNGLFIAVGTYGQAAYWDLNADPPDEPDEGNGGGELANTLTIANGPFGYGVAITSATLSGSSKYMDIIADYLNVKASGTGSGNTVTLSWTGSSTGTYNIFIYSLPDYSTKFQNNVSFSNGSNTTPLNWNTMSSAGGF